MSKIYGEPELYLNIILYRITLSFISSIYKIMIGFLKNRYHTYVWGINFLWYKEENFSNFLVPCSMRRSEYVPTIPKSKKIEKLTFPKSKKSQEFQKK